MDKDTEFLAMAEEEMASIENWLDDDDFDCSRNGNVLTIELDSGEQVVVNIQTPIHEIWFASRFGGHHFAWRDDAWRDSRTGRTLKDVIADALRRLGADL